ncbi:MAG: hypothetical protein KDH97_23590, partial [Calditrichaeota bacterium]|nr:hypothetical protein [Calditrichota bacterium]
MNQAFAVIDFSQTTFEMTILAQHDLTPAKQLIQKCRETRDPYLDLGNCGITDLNDLPELFECSHLETLILSNVWWDYGKFQPINSGNTGPDNILESIPEEMAQLNKLTKLVIGGGGHEL